MIDLQATRPGGSTISRTHFDIMDAMKQLLLRVPDDVHRRLAMRAAREGRSVNALATELLDLGAEADQGDRRARLRAKAAAERMLGSVPAPVVAPAERREVLASTRGLGPVADALIAHERDRL
jgi:plasmid stability protein